MLFVFHGSDIHTSRKKAHELIDALFQKNPSSNLFFLNNETFQEDRLREYTQSQGLFAQNYIVVLDRVLDSKENETIVLTSLQALSESSHVCIILEEGIDTKALKAITPHAARIKQYDHKVAPLEKQATLFPLTDALGKKDIKMMWQLYTLYRMKGVSAEEMHSMLMWQTRSLLAVLKSRTPEEAGMRQFVYTKSKNFLRNFSPKELVGMSRGLVEVFHRARRGESDFEEGLEYWILTFSVHAKG